MTDYRPVALPALSLGMPILRWADTHLVQPDGPDEGCPWHFTDDQARFVMHFYAIDEFGHFINRDATYRGVKGLGKSIFAAALAAIELCGPCRFAGWDINGNPLGMAVNRAWVDVVATSQSQTKNTFAALRAIFSQGTIEAYGLSIGQTIIRTAAGSTAQAVTASVDSLEGGRTTFAVMEETANWKRANRGHLMAEAITRNAAKSRNGGARTVQVTNAHEIGGDSVAERSLLAYESALDGRSVATGQLYWAWEPSPGFKLDNSDGSLMHALEEVYAGAPWIKLDRIMAEILDPRVPIDVSLRYYLNLPTAAADGLIEVDQLRACEDVDLRPLEADDVIVLGFDGSLRDDSTALIALRLEDRAFFLLGIQEKPLGPQGATWVVDRPFFRELVAATFDTYDVQAFAADVHPFESEIELWDAAYGDQLLVKMATHSSVGCDMRGNQMRIVKASDALVEAIVSQEITYNGDGTIRRHVVNARRRPNRYGFSFGKSSPDSQDKIDVYAAMVLAWHARAELIARGTPVEEPTTALVWR